MEMVTKIAYETLSFVRHQKLEKLVILIFNNIPLDEELSKVLMRILRNGLKRIIRNINVRKMVITYCPHFK